MDNETLKRAVASVNRGLLKKNASAATRLEKMAAAISHRVLSSRLQKQAADPAVQVDTSTPRVRDIGKKLTGAAYMPYLANNAQVSARRAKTQGFEPAVFKPGEEVTPERAAAERARQSNAYVKRNAAGIPESLLGNVKKAIEIAGRKINLPAALKQLRPDGTLPLRRGGGNINRYLDDPEIAPLLKGLSPSQKHHAVRQMMQTAEASKMNNAANIG